MSPFPSHPFSFSNARPNSAWRSCYLPHAGSKRRMHASGCLERTMVCLLGLAASALAGCTAEVPHSGISAREAAGISDEVALAWRSDALLVALVARETSRDRAAFEEEPPAPASARASRSSSEEWMLHAQRHVDEPEPQKIDLLDTIRKAYAAQGHDYPGRGVPVVWVAVYVSPQAHALALVRVSARSAMVDHEVELPAHANVSAHFTGTLAEHRAAWRTDTRQVMARVRSEGEGLAGMDSGATNVDYIVSLVDGSVRAWGSHGGRVFIANASLSNDALDLQVCQPATACTLDWSHFQACVCVSEKPLPAIAESRPLTPAACVGGEGICASYEITLYRAATLNATIRWQFEGNRAELRVLQGDRTVATTARPTYNDVVLANERSLRTTLDAGTYKIQVEERVAVPDTLHISAAFS
jgi:hypothetical protein